MSWQTHTYILKHPVTVGDQSYTTLTVYEPNAATLEAIDDSGVVEGQRPKIGQLRLVLAALTRVTNEVIGQLHRDDFEALLEAAVPFLVRQEAPSVQ